MGLSLKLKHEEEVFVFDALGHLIGKIKVDSPQFNGRTKLEFVFPSEYKIKRAERLTEAELAAIFLAGERVHGPT